MRTNSFFALVTGLAAGAVIGALLAPEKGSETRAKLRKAVAGELEKFRAACESAQEAEEETAEEEAPEKEDE